MKRDLPWVLLLALWLVLSVQAEDIYVSSSTGQDTYGCGSEQSPCLSLRGAVNQTTSQSPTYLFLSGVYSGPDNINLTISTSSLIQAADTQAANVVFDCQDIPNTVGLQFAGNSTLQNFLFTNCPVGVMVEASAASFELHGVNFTHCTLGLSYHGFELTASNVTATHCDTGVMIQSENPLNYSTIHSGLPEMNMTDCYFFNDTLASLRVTVSYKVILNLMDFDFLDTAGMRLDAGGALYSDCRMSRSRLQGVWPVEGDAEDSLVVLGGYFFLEYVDIVESVSCGIAVRSGNKTSVALYVHVDDSCDTAIKKTGDGEIRVQYSHLSPKSYGIVLTDMRKAYLLDLTLSGCANSSIWGNGTAVAYNIGQNVTFDHTGPLYLENGADTQSYIYECEFRSTRAIISGGYVKFNKGSYDNDDSEDVPADGGFLYMGALADTKTTLVLEYMTITGAHAQRRGGAVYIEPNVTTSLFSMQFINNKAHWGGAVYANQTAYLYSSSSSFVGNYASQDGGALYVTPYTGTSKSKPSFQLAELNFTSNQAYNSAGGVWMGGFYQPIFNGVRFTNNVANFGGGLFATGFTYLQVINTNFTGNLAHEDGGGMTMQSPSAVTLRFSDVEFTNNTANTGACISCCQGTCSNAIQFNPQSTELTCTAAENTNRDGNGLITCSPFFYPDAPGAARFAVPYWVMAISILLLAGLLLLSAWLALHYFLRKMFAPEKVKYSSLDREDFSLS